jgi:hypothetical protein
MRRKSEFFDTLLRGAGPSPELLGAFALGLLVVGILSNLVYDLLVAPESVINGLWRPVAGALIFTGIAYFLFWRDQRRRNVVVSVDESRLAPAHAGLIWLLGPQMEHLLLALDHHRQGGGAAHCWLVMQARQETVQKAYDELSSQILAKNWPIRLHPVYIDHLDAQAAYQAVQTIFTREAGEEGLTQDQLIADITGGVKPLTAGMILAALTVGGALEYVESERDDKGQAIEGTQRVVLVDTEFHLTREETL